jgi:hypothetical protein
MNTFKFRVVSVYGKKFKPGGKSNVSVPLSGQLFLIFYIDCDSFVLGGLPRNVPTACTFEHVRPNVKFNDIYYVTYSSSNIMNSSPWPRFYHASALNSSK